MDEEIFKAISNNDNKYFDEFDIKKLRSINFKLFEKKSDNKWYNYIKALYYIYELSDNKNAMKYYGISANQGCANAQYKLGYLYETKYKDYEKAQYWYEFAANQGYREAQSYLGYLYENKYQNYEKAIYWYELSNSQYSLAYLYEKLNDYEKAIYWYKKYHGDMFYEVIPKDENLNKYIIDKYFELIDENKKLKNELLKHEMDIDMLEREFNSL